MSHRASTTCLCCLLFACGPALPGAAAGAEPPAQNALDKRVDGALLAVIRHGVDLYNGGDRAGCYRLFEGGLLAVHPLLDHRPALQKEIDRARREAGRLDDVGQQAFRLRGALDRIREEVQGPTAAAKKPDPEKKPAPAAVQGVELSAREKEALELTNKEREKKGLKPLRANPLLFRAARAHSANMARQDRLAHDLDDKGPGERLKDVGYPHAGWGENVAAGQRTPAEALASWMSSDGHRANILNENYAEIGIGVVASDSGTLYWTQVFGTPRGR